MLDIDDDILLSAKRHCAEAVLGTVREREVQIWKRAGEVIAEASSPCKRHRPCADPVPTASFSVGAAAPPEPTRADGAPLPMFPSPDGSAAGPESAHIDDAAHGWMVKGARAMKHAMETDLAAYVPEKLHQIVRAALLSDRRLQQLQYDQEIQVLRGQVHLSTGGTYWPWPDSPKWTS